jgi:Flp pilus assembly protein TadG
MATPLIALMRDRRATASVEMALSLPLLIALLFGAFELGNYFMTEHIVVKAVRDGARYAARRPYSDYAGCTPSGSVITDTQNVTRTGQVASGGEPRFESWSDPDSITVRAECDTSGPYADAGVFVNAPDGAPVVRVSATVPYTPLFAQLGIARATLHLNAQSEAAVTGI